jgi:hypothetical protein
MSVREEKADVYRKCRQLNIFKPLVLFFLNCLFRQKFQLLHLVLLCATIFQTLNASKFPRKGSQQTQQDAGALRNEPSPLIRLLFLLFRFVVFVKSDRCPKFAG